MKLTKDQRHTAYILMLEEIDTPGWSGLCNVFKRLCEIDLDADYKFSNFKSMFPELWRRREGGRNERSTFLWDYNSERKEALKKCIEETADF